MVLIPVSALFFGPLIWADAISPTASAPTFDHSEHAKRLKSDDCSLCHSEASAARPAPTTRSHTPCLASGCHVDDFLSSGPRAKKDAPKAYAAAATFCSTCHKSASGEPPKRFAKAAADALFENKKGASYHVEMDHQAHSARTACSTCHVVDTKSFVLVKGRPNHLECRGCHEDDDEQPMSLCASCHSSPGPAQYFTKTRKASDVRSCSEATKAGRPCFKHERSEHRFRPDKTPLECSSCHYMFRKKRNNGSSYTSIADVKAAPIIDNRRDMAHKNCGSRGCHKREVDDSMGTGKCGYCHSKQFMAAGMFD